MAEEKIIIFDPHYCTGCLYCMTACSTYKNGATSLSKSRIHVVRHEGHAITKIDEEDDLIFDVIICQQCEDPYCLYLCPTLAIERSEETGALTIKHEKCVGCRMCIIACPFGTIFYDWKKKQIMKCDLCGGDPMCVRFCPTGALQFLPKHLVHLPVRDRLAKKIVQLRRRASEEKHLSKEGTS